MPGIAVRANIRPEIHKPLCKLDLQPNQKGNGKRGNYGCGPLQHLDSPRKAIAAILPEPLELPCFANLHVENQGFVIGAGTFSLGDARANHIR
jgi:hypothetical protein